MFSHYERKYISKKQQIWLFFCLQTQELYSSWEWLTSKMDLILFSNLFQVVNPAETNQFSRHIIGTHLSRQWFAAFQLIIIDFPFEESIRFIWMTSRQTRGRHSGSIIIRHSTPFVHHSATVKAVSKPASRLLFRTPHAFVESLHLRAIICDALYEQLSI